MTGTTAAAAEPRELTLRALVLGGVLAVLLGAANAYLGLFAGMTVSACIPSAVISMGVLRLLGHGGILENTMVMTQASAGEALAAAAIFTLPALVLLGVWDSFPYLWVTAIAGIGGVSACCSPSPCGARSSSNSVVALHAQLQRASIGGEFRVAPSFSPIRSISAGFMRRLPVFGAILINPGASVDSLPEW